jgi:hypothetical protein
MGRRPHDNPEEFNDVTIRLKLLADSAHFFFGTATVELPARRVGLSDH